MTTSQAGSAQVIAIRLHDPVPGEAWNALRAVASSRNAPVHGEYLDTGKEYEQFRTRSSYFDDGTVQPPQENS
jgi:hypothetical protein